MTDKLREKLINAGRVLVDEGQGDTSGATSRRGFPASPTAS